MPGKTILITGSTSGIGKAAAILFAKKGTTVIIVGRNKESTHKTVSDIQQKTGNNVKALVADLSSQTSIRNFAQEFRDKYKKLDVLINCAAVFTDRRIETKQGLELMFATNHLGPFLLTNLLLDSFNPKSRIINVTANSPLKPQFDDLQGKKKFNPMMAFGRTKAQNLLFTYALSRRLKDKGITVNAYHPGVTRGTHLMSHAPFYLRWVMSLASPFLLTPEQAAKGLVELALSDKFANINGQLIYKGKSMKDPLQNETTIQERLWDESMKLTGLNI